ncbi:MAG: hypothetical protein EOO77_08400 [Oxalobacteraceae bacterium]|nr:MAG: hypothetical protein EOO77_08400 [Oxalobacteraceae bacterium]
MDKEAVSLAGVARSLQGYNNLPFVASRRGEADGPMRLYGMMGADGLRPNSRQWQLVLPTYVAVTSGVAADSPASFPKPEGVIPDFARIFF